MFRVIIPYLCLHAAFGDKFELYMPNVMPDSSDEYLCTPVAVKSGEYYVTAFEPKATMDTAHHMLLYGCSTPGMEKSVWNCGAMSSKGELQSPCQGNNTILYAWGRNAPSLRLPQDVAFKIGDGTRVKYLVLQVHYVHKFTEPDASGIILHFTRHPTPKQAGVLLLGTGGRIPPKSVISMETACVVDEGRKILHPFAYRVHTHELGIVVTGYVVKRNGEWIRIGRRDPMEPQMFYAVEETTQVEPGDVLAASCKMKSEKRTTTVVGPTKDNEMCNFYVMYWTEGEPLDQNYCFTAGPPYYYWSSELENIPEEETNFFENEISD